MQLLAMAMAKWVLPVPMEQVADIALGFVLTLDGVVLACGHCSEPQEASQADPRYDPLTAT